MSKAPSADNLDEGTRHSIERLTRLTKPTWLDIPYYAAAVAAGAIAWAAGADPAVVVLAGLGAGFVLAVIAAACADARKTWRATESVWDKAASLVELRRALNREQQLTMHSVIFGPLTRWGTIDKTGEFRSGYAIGQKRAQRKAQRLSGASSPR